MTKEERAAKRVLWERRIADFKASGLSGAKWCVAHNLKTHQLWYWLKKLQPELPAEKPVQWLPVEIRDPGPALTVKIGPAAIEVPGGFDPQLLISVVRVLSTL
jgi:hypothetical protein